MTLKKLYFGTLGVKPSLFTTGLLNVTSNPQNTFYNYSKVKTGSAKDRPSSYFPKKSNSYFVVILGKEKYDLSAAQRLLRSVLYAKYIGLPIACFTTQNISEQEITFVKKLQRQHQLSQLWQASPNELLTNYVLLTYLTGPETENYIYSKSNEIYKELRKLRSKDMSKTRAKLSTKILNMPQKDLDIILWQSTLWQERFFTSILSEKLAAYQPEVQTPTSVTKKDTDQSIKILKAEATQLSETYDKLVSRKILGKLENLEKVDSPQTIMNLANKFYQVYTNCLERITFLKQQKFSSLVVKFVTKFISSYRDMNNFINDLLTDFKSQLSAIPLFVESLDDTLPDFYFNFYPTSPDDVINEFNDWVTTGQTSEIKAKNKAKTKPSKRFIYRFRADLVGSKPKIWRRFEIDGKRNMLELAQVIMVLFNMDGSHLYSLTNFIGDQKRHENSEKVEKKNALNMPKQGKKLNVDDVEKMFSLLESYLSNGAAFSKNIEYLMPGEDENMLMYNNVEVKPGETLLEDSQAKEKTRFRFEYDFGDAWRVDLKIEKIETVTNVGQILTTVLKGKGPGIIEDIGGIPELMNYQENPEDHEAFGAYDAHQEFNLTELNKRIHKLNL